jgi:malate dehydrogenase (oxaloacetate-decarboxylating)
MEQKKIIRTLRCKNVNIPGVLGELTSVVGSLQGWIGEVKTIEYGRLYVIRDIEILVDDEDCLTRILEAVSQLKNITILEVRDEVLEAHQNGKIEVTCTHPVKSVADLRKVYTPGVANVCMAIYKQPELADHYTSIPRMVAIVTDGSRVLGLGDIGPQAAMPVMEGKAALLRQLVGLSGIPILLSTKDPDQIVETVINIAPTFGAIQLEDIATPRCFEIEKRLIEALDIPVMHDDQHGTAVVTLAAIINVCKYLGLEVKKLTIGQIGLGAAGQAISAIVKDYTAKAVLGVDPKEEAQRRFIQQGGIIATQAEIMEQCDIVIATTGLPRLIDPRQIRKGQIILALSNPEPEIDPSLALEHGAAFAADGKSVNNILGFPGILRGAIDVKAKQINSAMYIAAAEAIASWAHQGELVPNPLDLEVHWAVSRAVARAAMDTGVARIQLDDDYFMRRDSL